MQLRVQPRHREHKELLFDSTNELTRTAFRPCHRHRHRSNVAETGIRAPRSVLCQPFRKKCAGGDEPKTHTPKRNVFVRYYFDHTTVWQLVRLDQHRRVVRELVLELRVERNIAELLFDLSNRLEIRSSIERITSLQRVTTLNFKTTPSSSNSSLPRASI